MTEKSKKKTVKRSAKKTVKRSTKKNAKPVGKKPKPLPPTMRTKKRYIFFQLNSSKPLNAREVSSAVLNECSYLFGSIGVSKMNLQLIDFNSFSGEGILRCAREKLDETKSALLFVKNINGFPVRPQILKVSGTLKKLRKKKK